ncbi:hypothetical protein ABL78_6214 [Leptomonas seymouri]|uniref:Dephospho-CoA kinase n=1 Tax=Leptomonas seymouri TaxID=5684 RepID=A0A0N1I144_LEPSE|nr:hypothetical protein ABL78_6214 [Leptomonas seymouri]|eukprot:KPI84721.1 hypothetical protein ABL78_6214 [Leptomonas seymouri]
MRAILTLGFTGTIASGKSSRCKRLVEVAAEHQRALGIGTVAAKTMSHKPNPPSQAPTPYAADAVLTHYINADLVGHHIYEPGKPCYRDLVQHFGTSILSRTSASEALKTEGGRGTSASVDRPPFIDRRVLGEIVFSDERKLRELNSICWPYISAAIRAEHLAVCARATATAPPSGIDTSVLDAVPRGPAVAVALIIVEAALLCDLTDILSLTTDLWMTHCTPWTAVDRLMQRNGLSREAAERRVSSQREVGEKLQTLREFSYRGDIKVFDTTQISLAEGLKETEKAFNMYWKQKVLVHLSCGSGS